MATTPAPMRLSLIHICRGNFACGIKEQIIFPEIDFDKVDAVRGMDVCFVTTAKTDEEGKELLKACLLYTSLQVTSRRQTLPPRRPCASSVWKMFPQ